MIVSTCSYGSTGSSAVSDYLKECENTQVLDKFEFTIATCTDGLSDLEYHLVKKNARQNSSIYAIQRFKKVVERHKRSWHRHTGIPKENISRYTNSFINNITQVKYVGPSPRIHVGSHERFNRIVGNSLIMTRVIRPLEKKKIIKKNHNFYPYEEVNLSIHPDNFYDESKKFTRRLLKGMGADFSKIVVLDQAFSGSDPVSAFPFYDSPYAIIVDRDPRDVFIFAKEVLLSRGRFIPTDRVEDYIKYYRLIRSSKERIMEDKRCLFLQFEDMVYNYDNTVCKIDKFLNVVNKNRKTIFVPEMSVANTNLIRKFPKYAKEVELIEKELSEYLFDFSKYPDVDNKGEMFFGKSPLNK